MLSSDSAEHGPKCCPSGGLVHHVCAGYVFMRLLPLLRLLFDVAREMFLCHRRPPVLFRGRAARSRHGCQVVGGLGSNFFFQYALIFLCFNNKCMSSA